jgi:hypothetical protein
MTSRGYYARNIEKCGEQTRKYRESHRLEKNRVTAARTALIYAAAKRVRDRLAELEECGMADILFGECK